MIPENIIEAEVDQIIFARISATVNSFRRSLDISRLEPNYQSTLMTYPHAVLARFYNVDDLTFTEGSTGEMAPCSSCDIDPICKINLALAPDADPTQVYNYFVKIPHLLTGCNFINTLMASTLECFFNQTCLETVKIARNATISLTALRLNALFPPNTTIRTIVNKMFIESWNKTFNYSAFYHTCHPSSCFYTVTVRKNIGVLIASIIGGLDIALNLLVPQTVRFTRDKGKELYKKLRLRMKRGRTVFNSAVETWINSNSD